MTRSGLDKKNSDEERVQALRDWFERWLDGSPERGSASPGQIAYSVVSGDASFRRYFRAALPETSFILVDAPPAREDSRPFVHLARILAEEGVHVPKVYHADFEQGFMCLSDLSDTLLWEKLDEAKQRDNRVYLAGGLYQRAFDELLKIQRCRPAGDYCLPPFSRELLRTEMGLFETWFCESLLGLSLSAADRALLEDVFHFLIEAAVSQPQICVHRDYHSRNLLCDGGAMGVIDFQDAVLGPVTYDLVSLLKDCYIGWPREVVEGWALTYLEQAVGLELFDPVEPEAFLRDFTLMGLQRHLKAIGIFSRLFLRDGKPGYLPDIPRTLNYILEVTPDHEPLQGFGQWLQDRVLPRLDEALDGKARGGSTRKAR